MAEYAPRFYLSLDQRALWAIVLPFIYCPLNLWDAIYRCLERQREECFKPGWAHLCLLPEGSLLILSRSVGCTQCVQVCLEFTNAAFTYCQAELTIGEDTWDRCSCFL